jgi:hypothetical protein
MSIENFGLNSPVRITIELCSDKEEVEWKGFLPSYKGEKLFPYVTKEDEDLLKRLFSIRTFYGTYEEKENTTILFSIEEIQRIRELDIYLDIPTTEYVCNNDFYTMCENLLKRGVQPERKFLSFFTFSRIASRGFLNLLKWSKDNGCPWDTDTYFRAVENGHLNVLQWAKKNGCPWDTWVCSYAAEKGRLEELKKLTEYGCPWNQLTCACAARGGHIEVLKWARENGCPWDRNTRLYANASGHLHISMWAMENGCP